MIELNEESKRLIKKVVDGVVAQEVMLDRHLPPTEIYMIPSIFPESIRREATKRVNGEIGCLFGYVDDIRGWVAGHPVFAKYSALSVDETEYLRLELKRRKDWKVEIVESASDSSRRPAEKFICRMTHKCGSNTAGVLISAILGGITGFLLARLVINLFS